MNKIDSYNILLNELKEQEINNLKEKYEKELKYINDKSYSSLGELLNCNKNYLKKYPELNEEFVKHYVEKHNSYDDRYFYLNKEKISKEHFFSIIKDKEFEMNLDLRSYTEQIFINLGKDKLEIYYYIGD